MYLFPFPCVEEYQVTWLYLIIENRIPIIDKDILLITIELFYGHIPN